MISIIINTSTLFNTRRTRIPPAYNLTTIGDQTILHLFETLSKKASGTNISDFREHIQERSRHAEEGLVGTCGDGKGRNY
jgi:hypothetical protein